jgi:hypothetical protein
MDIVKKDATITNTDDAFPGSFEVILSSQTKDRDGETLLKDGWKLPLPEHITFDSDHGMTVEKTVGSGVPRIDEETGNLIVSGTYSSLSRAQEVRTLVNEGHIRTTSVAFMTEKTQKDGATVTQRELLNGAFVAIPSNREALVLSSKGLKAGARNSASDAEKIQGIHDHAAALGAECVGVPAKSVKSAETKALVGSLEATQDRVRDAIQDANPGLWVYLRGTVPDGSGGGYVVFAIENPETYDSDLFKQSYIDDGSVVTLTGDAAPVDVLETVTPDSDEDAAAPGADQAPAAGASTAPATGVRSAPVADADSDAVTVKDLEAQALQIQAAQFIN